MNVAEHMLERAYSDPEARRRANRRRLAAVEVQRRASLATIDVDIRRRVVRSTQRALVLQPDRYFGAAETIGLITLWWHVG